MSTQRKVDRLQIRAQSAALIGAVIAGHRQSLPIDNATLTRWIKGDVSNPIEYLRLMIRCLPAEAGAALLAAGEDEYESTHGGEVRDFYSEWLEAHDADTTESNLRGKIRRADGTYDPDAVNAWLTATFREAKEKRDARIAWQRDSVTLRHLPTAPAMNGGWPQARKRNGRRT